MCKRMFISNDDPAMAYILGLLNGPRGSQSITDLATATGIGVARVEQVIMVAERSGFVRAKQSTTMTRWELTADGFRRLTDAA